MNASPFDPPEAAAHQTPSAIAPPTQMPTASIWQRRLELIALLARKEWNIRYRSAALGYAWAVLQPLLLMIVLLTVFSVVVPLNAEKYPETRPYILFLLTGLFPWHFSSVALSSGTPSFPNSMKLIKLSAFPRDVLPLGVVAAHLANLLMTFPLLLPVYLAFGQFPGWSLMLLPVVIALHAAILGALTMLVALANVRFTDTFFLVQALLLPWFYATPVFYPRRAAGEWAAILWLNPTTSVTELYRVALMPGWPTGDIILNLGVASVWAVLLLTVAYAVHKRSEPTLADWL